MSFEIKKANISWKFEIEETTTLGKKGPREATLYFEKAINSPLQTLSSEKYEKYKFSYCDFKTEKSLYTKKDWAFLKFISDSVDEILDFLNTE